MNVAERPILNAIATALFGLNAAEIHQIHHNEADWQRWADSFAEYQRTWQRKGVLPMLHRLLLEQGIAERLLSQPTGERDLTDFLHLAEILQQAATLNESEAALLSWFEKQILGEGRQEVQIRLESERQLVKIVTIHKSKGLEYDLVWLPFLGIPTKDPVRKGNINLYYCKEKDSMIWDMEDQHLQSLYDETFAEELRLLYVALTRAKYQMAFALPAQFEQKWNALLYVLSQGEIGNQMALEKNYDTLPLLQSFQTNMQSGVEITPSNQLEALPPLRLHRENTELSAATFNGNIEQDWHITSFSSIENSHSRKQYGMESADRKSTIFDDEKDYDMEISPEISLTLDSENLSDMEKMLSALPRGKRLERHYTVILNTVIFQP